MAAVRKRGVNSILTGSGRRVREPSKAEIELRREADAWRQMYTVAIRTVETRNRHIQELLAERRLPPAPQPAALKSGAVSTPGKVHFSRGAIQVHPDQRADRSRVTVHFTAASAEGVANLMRALPEGDRTLIGMR